MQTDNRPPGVLPGRTLPPSSGGACSALTAPSGGVGTGEAGPSSPGLVCPSTSHTFSSDIFICPEEYRDKRVRMGIVRGAEIIEMGMQSAGNRYRAAMVTTTYRPGVVYDPLQIALAVNNLRNWASRRGARVRYVWRLEFGARSGRLHYHVVVWLPRGLTMPKWDKAGWWPHGMTKMEWARRPVGYLAKYASKASTAGADEFSTKGARWWGIGGLDVAGRCRLRLLMAPGWVRSKAEAMGVDIVRRVGFGWWRIGAWEFRSPWEYLGLSLFGETMLRWRGWDEFAFELGT